MLLTPYEYDQLPNDAKAALAAVNRYPRNDVKSDHFRRRYGAFLNGELYADPTALQVVGYGTNSPFTPA
jgi:hypothetical protein